MNLVAGTDLRQWRTCQFRISPRTGRNAVETIHPGSGARNSLRIHQTTADCSRCLPLVFAFPNCKSVHSFRGLTTQSACV